MTACTRLEQNEIELFLNQYDLGVLQSFAALKTSLTNTNYHLVTSNGDYLLTLFEEMPLSELPFYLSLNLYFVKQDFPCAMPITNKHGEIIRILAEKPAVIMDFLPGQTIQQANAAQIQAIGDLLGRLHLSGKNCQLEKRNFYGDDWLNSLELEPFLETLPISDALLLQEELGLYHQQNFAMLPQGLIHGSPYPGHLLFTDNKISGVLDFYFACADDLLLDLAIAANTWCKDSKNQLDPILASLLIESYQKHRPLTALEKRFWPDIRQVACLRFWIAQLLISHQDNSHLYTLQKDPNEYRDILQQLRNYDHIVS